MMKGNIYLTIAILLVGLLGGSCTRNDGDIGDLFGWWTLDTLTADGVAQDFVTDEMLLCTWAFQSSVMHIQETLPYADFYRVKGTWERPYDDTLLLNFGHTDDAGGYYTPPAWLHLIRGITPMTIVTLTHKKMHLRYTNPDDGVTYDYYLSKAI